MEKELKSAIEDIAIKAFFAVTLFVLGLILFGVAIYHCCIVQALLAIGSIVITLILGQEICTTISNITNDESND